MQVPKIHQIQTNFCAIELLNGVIYISYNTPVALEVLGDAKIQYVRRKEFFSVTTSRHLNKHCRAYRLVEEPEWEHLLAQVLGEEKVETTESADERFKRYIQL